MCRGMLFSWYYCNYQASYCRKHNILYFIYQCRTNVENVGPTLYNCYTIGFYLLRYHIFIAGMVCMIYKPPSHSLGYIQEQMRNLKKIRLVFEIYKKTYPSNHKTYPSNHKKNPAITKHIPAITKHIPAITKHIPAITKHIPAITKHIPAITKLIPAITKHIPAITKHIPAIT